jgi:hypothetical protein
VPVHHCRSASPPESLGAAGSHNAALCVPPSGARGLLVLRNDNALTEDGRKPRACPSLNITCVLCFLRRAGSAPCAAHHGSGRDVPIAPCRRRRQRPAHHVFRRRHRARVRDVDAMSDDGRWPAACIAVCP